MQKAGPRARQDEPAPRAETGTSAVRPQAGRRRTGPAVKSARTAAEPRSGGPAVKNARQAAASVLAERLASGGLKIAEPADAGDSGGERDGGRFWESAHFRTEAKIALKFLAGTALVFAALHIVFSLLVPLWLVEAFYANLAVFLAGIFGLHGGIITAPGEEPVLIFLLGVGMPVSISYLCTGLLEMLLLVAAVAASFGIEIRKRMLGIAGAVAATMLFNILRITASILLIAYAGLGIAELGHEILFRLFLFVTIAGYYTWWFRWATGKEGAGK